MGGTMGPDMGEPASTMMAPLVDRAAETLQKHQLVARDILRAIQLGKLAPGARLPNEAELAQKHAVSRNSVRRGLMHLQNEGLIEKRQGSGTYVSRRANAWLAPKREMSLAVRYVAQSTESMIGHASGPWWSPLREGLMYGAAYHQVKLVEDPCGSGSSRSAFSPPTALLAGFLVVAFANDNPSDLMPDLPRSVPRLLVNRSSTDPQIPSLSIDREWGAHEATAFLLKLGHRRIGIDVRGDDDPPGRERLRGYCRAFEAASLPVDEAMIFEGVCGPAYLEWPKRLHSFLQREPRPTALLVHHANRVLHIMEVLQARGIRVPEDLSLIIIDDDPSLSRMKPRLSAISEPYAEMGRRAVAMIVAGTKAGQEAQHATLEPQLVMRESVAPLRR